MSYWTATNKIPINQKSVRIPAENGVNYNAGQEIRVRIDPGLKFFNPQQTMLEADVVIIPPTYTTNAPNSIAPTRLQLDAETGFQSLCRTVRVHDSNGNLLEEIDNYNTLVSVMYDYHTNDSLRGKRALTEGSTAYKADSRGSEGTTKSVQNDFHTNPYFKPSSGVNTDFVADDFISAKVIIPIHTGIFQNDRIFPNMLLGGITLTILLEDNRFCFRQMESVMRFRKLNLNPQFFGTDAAGTAVATNGSFSTVFLGNENSQSIEVEQCPFVVGEKVGFERFSAIADARLMAWATTTIPAISTISFNSGASQKISLGLTPLSASSIIGVGPTNASDWYMYSRSVSDASSYNATYRVENVALIVQEVDAGLQYENEMMKKMREGGVINYDFQSFTTYKYSQLASDRVANIRIPIENSRAKSILCVPLDSTPYTTQEILNASETYKIEDEGAAFTENPTNFSLRSCRPNLEGIVDHITDYQFLYNQRLQPNRRVDLTRISSKKAISGQHLIELDKALSQAGINGHSMARFNKNFVIGRALSIGDSYYDARNKDFSLQVNYQQTIAPTKAKLWCVFCSHIRRIEMKSGNVQVII